jgi:hypothetical protein
MYVIAILWNYAHDFDFFVQCAEEFEAMCNNKKNSAEESRLIGVDEIMCMTVCLGLSANPFYPCVHMSMHRN